MIDVEANQAAASFLGQGKYQFSHLEYDICYHPEICHYLLQLVSNNAKLIRVIFHDAGGNNTTTFKKQLQELILLSNRLDRPALFIDKEPGAENHFIMGLVKEGQLLFINPLGLTQHADCYQTFAELIQEKILTHVWFSTNTLQRQDYEEGLVSCGPIVLALAIHVLTTFTPEGLDTFWKQLNTHQPKLHNASNLVYHEINIQPLLPDLLKTVQTTANSAQYKNLLTTIRQNHYKLLDQLPLELAKGMSVNEFLEKCKDESPAQVLFNQLALEGKTITRIDELPEYSLLVSELNSHRFLIEGQPGDRTMETKTLASTRVSAQPMRSSDRIALDVNGIKEAIEEQISDQNLQTILIDLLQEAQVKQELFNKRSLKDATFCGLRDKFISRMKSIMQTVSKDEKYKDDDKDIALTQIFPDMVFPFWRCRPYQKTETTKEAEHHQQKEQQLFLQQKYIRTQSIFLEALGKINADREPLITIKPKFYFMYALPVEDYRSRESQVQSFLQGLQDDLTIAGIEIVFEKEDNFSGNNLNHFMGQILHDNCIVLVFGTESFRHKWFDHKTALQVEGDLLQLKWLTDLSEGRIKPNQGITIIPFVLTGIRETAIPEDLLPAKNPTVRALYHLSYKNILSSLLAVAYGITEQAIAKYIPDTPDQIIIIDPPSHSASTNYSAVQPQTFFGQGNRQISNNSNLLIHTKTSSFTSMEIEEESNTNVPK